MSYNRVIPRDLFNESKLLKSLGRLALLIHEQQAPAGLAVHQNGEETNAFDIRQDESDGGLYVSNLIFTRPGNGVLVLKTGLNSKLPFPLFVDDFDYGSIYVFDDDGSLSIEFLKYCNTGRRAGE